MPFPVLRYLKDKIDDEPERIWNKKMRSLVQEMIHYLNSLAPGEETDGSDLKSVYTIGFSIVN